MKLTLTHIQHYPIGGENALKILNQETNKIDMLWGVRKFPQGDEYVSLIDIVGSRSAIPFTCL